MISGQRQAGIVSPANPSLSSFLLTLTTSSDLRSIGTKQPPRKTLPPAQRSRSGSHQVPAALFRGMSKLRLFWFLDPPPDEPALLQSATLNSLSRARSPRLASATGLCAARDPGNEFPWGGGEPRRRGGPGSRPCQQRPQPAAPRGRRRARARGPFSPLPNGRAAGARGAGRPRPQAGPAGAGPRPAGPGMVGGSRTAAARRRTGARGPCPERGCVGRAGGRG